MTKLDFVTLCEMLSIHPAIALEHEGVRAALAARDDKEVERILRTEF